MKLTSTKAKVLALAAADKSSGYVFIREEGDLFSLFQKGDHWIVQLDLSCDITIRATCDTYGSALKLFREWRKERRHRGYQYRAKRALKALVDHGKGLEEDGDA